ncbi:hypothetical protein [Bdellovibrio sp. HCB337]|uniref:hypothetical protein n=1 Tax=Bdellovibrio sp. HCB337 TaxID=3394358 RepID=UPI0039A585B9
MSKNETLTQQEEQQIGAIFSQLRDAKVEAPLYMKTRVLAHLNEDGKQKKSLLFWKILSMSSLASLAIVLFVGFQMMNKHSEEVLAKQAYVIHIDFNQMDQQMVAGAEIELPEDVRFVSSNKEIQKEKRLKLPVSVKSLGRGKLPFVVTSDLAGEKSIRVRLLNEKDELVREQIFKVKFAKEGASVAF